MVYIMRKQILFYVSNKGAEKHVNWRSMTSAFVISIMEGFYTKKSIFLLASLGKQDSLTLIWDKITHVEVYIFIF